MSQSDLDRLVAAATGESRRTVSQLGFSLADNLEPNFDPEPAGAPPYPDWDEIDSRRYAELALHERAEFLVGAAIGGDVACHTPFAA